MKPDPGTKTDGSPRGRCSRKPKHPAGEPKPSAQRNFTDRKSWIMEGRDGFVQAYNAQAAVDAKAKVILAHHLSNNAAGQDALGPLLDALTTNTDAKPAEVSADSGYVATGRAKHSMVATTDVEDRLSLPCGSGSGALADADATGYANGSSGPSPDKSNSHEGSDRSCSASSGR